MSDAPLDHSKRQPSHLAYVVRDGKDGQKGRWSEIGAALGQRRTRLHPSSGRDADQRVGRAYATGQE
jgi:hypothetical protein